VQSRNYIFFIIALLTILFQQTKAVQQNQVFKDFTTVYQCSDSNKHKQQFPEPDKVAIRSVILPGWGQLTNKQYYKLPILYAGLATCVYFIDFNNKEYKTFKQAYIYRVDNDPNTIDVFDPVSGTDSDRYESPDQLKSFRDYYRRNLEFTIIITAGVYALNIVDAYVYAHLRDFDISDELTLNILSPNIYNFANVNFFTTGIVINFK